MLIAEDLMWGAQPDLKLTLNVNKSQPENVESQKSSLASLLCSQLLQHQQQQINDHQKVQQINLNQHPDVKIKIMDSFSIANPNAFTIQSQETRIGSKKLLFKCQNILNKKLFSFVILAPETIEWTMNDLLQLRKQPSTMKINQEDENASVSNINQSEHQLQAAAAESIVKCREKSNLSHKRPSLACEISSSKRAKGQETTTSQKKKEVTSDSRWSPMTTPQKAQQQASNSVLMNLLVSGCDVSAGYYTCLPRPKVAKA